LPAGRACNADAGDRRAMLRARAARVMLSIIGSS
jgi:hypothetical protein